MIDWDALPWLHPGDPDYPYDEVLPPEPEPEPAPLWGKDGPAIGQVIALAGTAMRARWTGTCWELVE